MGTISKNFSYSEFERSDTARQRGICSVICTAAVRDAIKELTLTILQPLRDAWGKPLTVSSGYRCKELNDAIGGSKTSAHLTGNAVDIQVDASSSQEQFNAFAVKFLMERGIAFDQCIKERSGRTEWLHIGLRSNAGLQRRQTFIITK